MFKERLDYLMERSLGFSRELLSVKTERLEGLSPLIRLSQGYAFVRNEEGRQLVSISQVNTGEKIEVNLKDGSIKARVEDVEAKNHE